MHWDSIKLLSDLALATRIGQVGPRGAERGRAGPSRAEYAAGRVGPVRAEWEQNSGSATCDGHLNSDSSTCPLEQWTRAQATSLLSKRLLSSKLSTWLMFSEAG